MRITIEADLPGEPLEVETITNVTAYVIGYKRGHLVQGVGHQVIFPMMKVLGEQPSAVRVGLLEMADFLLLQRMKDRQRPNI